MHVSALGVRCDLGVNARERDAFSGASNDKGYRCSLKDDKGSFVRNAYRCKKMMHKKNQERIYLISQLEIECYSNYSNVIERFKELVTALLFSRIDFILHRIL